MIDSAKSKWGQQGRTVRDRIKKIDLGLVLLIALPLILLSITRLWLFPRLGSGDSWGYFGYFVRPVQFLNAQWHLFIQKELAYGDSRLPWIMAGALVYHLFPPLIANYVLHLSFYHATVLSVYGTLKCTVGKRSGLLAAILLGTYGYFMVSQNWDYVEVAVLAYFSLTVFFLTLATKMERWRLALIGAGCFYGAMVYSNTTAIGLTLALGTYYFLSNHRHRRNPILPSIGYSLLGLTGVTVFFGIINYIITGNLFFFMPAFRYVFAVAKHEYAHIANITPLSLNIHQWLWLPFLISCTSLISIMLTIVKSGRDRSLIRSLPVFSVTYLLCLLPHVFLELQGQSVLRLYYYASYLIPSMFLAMGEQVSLVMEHLPRRLAGGLIAGTFVLQILTFRQLLYRMASQGFSHSAALVDIQNLMRGTAILVGILIIVLLLLRLISIGAVKQLKQWITLKLILMVTLLGFYYCFNFQALFALFGSDNGAWNRLLYTSIPEDSMLATIQTHNILREIDPEVEMLFWFKENESTVFPMVDSHSLAINRNIGKKRSRLTGSAEETLNLTKARFGKLPRLVVLSQKPDIYTMQQTNVELASIGFTSKFISSYDIVQGDIRFKMTIIQVIEK